MPRFVHIVDDDASFRTAIGNLLKQAGYEVAMLSFRPASPGSFAERKCAGLHPSQGEDGRTEWPGSPEHLSAVGSTLPIIFLTRYPDIPTAVRTIKAGAEDFLIKPVSSDQLLQTVERAFAHHEAMRGVKGELVQARADIAKLTPRERQVFELIIRGQTNKHVARALGPTERTIKAHRQRVMEKMQVRSLVELVSLAERVGVLSAASDI